MTQNAPNWQYDYIVMFGRFEPPHIGHKMVIEKALALAKQVIILVGSCNQPRTIKNPWTFEERASMIRGMFDLYNDPTAFSLIPNANIFRFTCLPIHDQVYNDQQWVADAQRTVADHIMKQGWTNFPPRVALIGHKKDETSYYLDMFPQWDSIQHPLDEKVNATDIRNLYFEQTIKYIKYVVPTNVFDYLETFQRSADYQQLVDEHEFIKDYKKKTHIGIHPPTFVTVDAIVVQSGHLLLVRRKKLPGRGLLALVGGFLNQREKLVDGMLRELKEETKIKVPDKVLRGCIKANKVYDAPNRSLRGRTVTHAFLIELPPGVLPKVKGGDDAEAAIWVPFNDVHEETMFEDHFYIFKDLVGKI